MGFGQRKTTHALKTGPKIFASYKKGAISWSGSNEWARVRSSNVAAIKYDKFGKTMWVKFKNNTIYLCLNFPLSLARQYFNCKSMGKFHWKLRRMGYVFQNVS